MAQPATSGMIAPLDAPLRPLAGGRHFSGRETKWSSLPTWTIYIVAAVGLLSYISIYPNFLNSRYPIVRSDGVGYYSYLPAYLLQHDPTFKTFVAHDLRQTEYAAGFKLDKATGNYIQRYPVGEAIMVAPFFLVGHAFAEMTGQHANGFSKGEEWASGAAALVYMVGGLTILRKTLRRYFGPIVTSAVLLSITFGTSLFHYSTFDSMFSHAFSFFLLAAFIELVHRWDQESSSTKLTVLLGIVAGMTLLVRQSNGVFFLLLPLFGIGSLGALRSRASNLWDRRGELVTMLAVAALVFSPQLLIWHEATGHWIINSYAGSGAYFNFPHSRIVKTLFSFYPHGLFPWAPVLLLACLGFVFLRRYAPDLVLSVVAVVAVNAYIISCWIPWSYSAGFGLRAFVDSLPLMAFPLGALFSRVRSLWTRTVVGTSTFACCALTTIQMIHYWQLKLPFLGAPWSQYWHLIFS